MPSSAARAFIFATNASNEPAEFTPSAIAASLALSTSIAPITASSTSGACGGRCPISFDAAWGNEETPQLLKILDEQNVKATFFLVGEWVDKYPDDVKTIAARGHDIGNHSNTHPHMPQLSKDTACAEIKACNDKICKLTGSAPTLFRPPYGDYDNMVVDSVKQMGMYCVQWDVDSLDWKDPTPEQMTKTVLDKVKDGSIVLMHNGAKNTPAALPGIIKGIKDKGFEIVLIKDLIPEGEYYTDVQGEFHLMEN